MSLLSLPFPYYSARAMIIAALIFGTVAGLVGPEVAARWGHHARIAAVPTTVVRRTDVESVVLSPGVSASSQNSEIHCQLERLQLTGQVGLSSGGASTILSLIPDGSMVQKGDVLCELDGSDYEELLRKQQIVVEQARTDHVQALLTRDVAVMALESYREGERAQLETQYKGQIALARSDVERHSDRLEWTNHMLDKGYVSRAQLATDLQTELRLKESLRSMEQSFRNYSRFTAPMELMSLQKQVNGAESTLGYQTIRLKREEERLAHYQKLADQCVIRAPHAGFVIHANRPGRDPLVYLGAPVRERMLLFRLPDLTKMEVQVMLHETVVDRVRPGMSARIQIDALPGRTLYGRVESINTMPLSDQNSNTANQIAYFIAHVRLENVPDGLRPGMTAAATILRGGKTSALALPVTAVAVEDGRNICYVAREDGFERRPIEVVPADHAFFEVTDGLKEGDVVAIDPSSVPPVAKG